MSDLAPSYPTYQKKVKSLGAVHPGTVKHGEWQCDLNFVFVD